jgi:hypothetical protein
MIIHKLLLDKQRWTRKPDRDKGEIGKINNRIIYHPVEISIEELATNVTQPNGKSWTTAYLIPTPKKDKKGNTVTNEKQEIVLTRQNEGWKSQSLFALDFDNTKSSILITLDDILKRLEFYGLNCTFAYNTFSNSESLPKFRVVFQTKQVVTNLYERQRIVDALHRLFPEADNIKEPARIFFGGRELIYTNYSYFLDINLLTLAAKSEATSNSKNLSRDLTNLEKATQKDAREYSEICSAVCVYENESYYINKYSESHFYTQQHTSLQEISWQSLKHQVKIIKDLESGKWLTYSEYFGLVTNLIHIKGGTQKYKKWLELMRKNNESTEDWKTALSVKPRFFEVLLNLPSIVKKYGYRPAKLKNFSPYREDDKYNTLIQASKTSSIIRTQPYTTISLSKAERQFKQLFSNALKAKNNKVYVFKVATGLGKTRLIETLNSVVLAFPTHQLKEEVGESRMKVECEIIPELPTNIPEELKNRLNQLYKVGATTEASRIIKQEADNYEELKKYRHQFIRAIESTSTVLTTHDKALFIDFPHLNTIVFDEDPIHKLLSIGSITKKDLLTLKSNIIDKGDKNTITNLIKEIESSRTNCPLAMQPLVFNKYIDLSEEVINNSNDYEGKILDFFDSNFYAIDSHDTSIIHYIKKNKLPNKKVIILSATADRNFYEELVGNRLEFHDLSNVELKGIILQDSTYSFSRYSLKNSKCVEYALKQTKDYEAVITFAAYKSHFPNAVENMHIGNVLGYDGLKGKKIAIIGTPYHNHLMYALFAACLGVQYKASDFQMTDQTIERNGIQFNIKTYKNEGLRNIHLTLMEAELRQAIGRARLVREPGEVLLLSGLPLPEACISDEEKADKRQQFEINKAVANTESVPLLQLCLLDDESNVNEQSPVLSR